MANLRTEESIHQNKFSCPRQKRNRQLKPKATMIDQSCNPMTYQPTVNYTVALEAHLPQGPKKWSGHMWACVLCPLGACFSFLSLNLKVILVENVNWKLQIHWRRYIDFLLEYHTDCSIRVSWSFAKIPNRLLRPYKEIVYPFRWR